MSNPLRSLPAVHDLLGSPAFARVLEQYPRETVVEAVRGRLDQLREELKSGKETNGQIDAQQLAGQIQEQLSAQTKPRLRQVINATGVLLHTNLGRAPMAPAAAEAAALAARGYLNLELDLETGKRSNRPDAVRAWLNRLLGSESATVVNNNAAATVIALRALAQGKEVVVSRGQLVEIGGSFRIPEIMATSGAILREVGSTNITRIEDYSRAINEKTGLLLRVHCSNYRVIGHTETPGLEELLALGRLHNIPVVDDIGSGALVDLGGWGLLDEPLAKTSLALGADVVMFSGDKLLGGPQCGILAGRAPWISKIEKDPLMRAFRVDKMTLAALEATLRIYFNPEKALQEIPLLRMLETPIAALQERAYLLARLLGSLPGVSANVQNTQAFVGGGSLPDRAIPSIAVALRCNTLSETELAYRLRTSDPAVMGRVEEGQVLLDLRAVFTDQYQALADAVRSICQETQPSEHS
jgi:L-seryl-tRNA(Ser) seleniumtransferase